MITAKDPVAAVRGFHEQVRLCLEELFGTCVEPVDLSLDGVASRAEGGIAGDVLAFFGVIEP